MAKFTPGPMAGQISGRLGATIFSHNKGGPYVRNGTIPTKVTSDYAVNAKARLASLSSNWRNLTDHQAQAWELFASESPVTDRLGKQILLSGHQTYIAINARLLNWAQAPLTIPPVGDAPDPLTSLSFACDTVGSTCPVAFAPTPLGAAESLELYACVTQSAGIRYVQNLYAYFYISAVASGSPADLFTALETRFGELQPGMKLFLRARTAILTTGLVSGWRQASEVIT